MRSASVSEKMTKTIDGADVVESKVHWPRNTQSKKDASELGSTRAVVTSKEWGATSIEVAMLGVVAACSQRVITFQSTKVLFRGNMLQVDDSKSGCGPLLLGRIADRAI